MDDWSKYLKKDPDKRILSSGIAAVSYFYERDILGIRPGKSLEDIWRSREPKKIVGAQQKDGSWSYPGGKDYIRSKKEYASLETYRRLGILIEKYGFKKSHPCISKACEFLFSFQTSKGDFRCIYANQYSPNYSAGILELMIKAGYGKDKRVSGCFEWLLSARQDDGGWAIPFRTGDTRSLREITKIFRTLDTVEPDKSKPFSHLATGVVLRAFAADGRRKKSRAVKEAAKLLKGRFFSPDKYPDRRSSKYWEKIRFPFWYTDILSSLDSLSRIGFEPGDIDIQRGLEWLIENQRQDGLWGYGFTKSKDTEKDYWVSLAVCRVFKRFLGKPHTLS